MFFSYPKNSKTDLPFNKLQIITTLASSIVNNQPPINGQFSKQILYRGLCSFAKNNTINKNISNEHINILKNEHLILQKNLASFYSNRKDNLLHSNRKRVKISFYRQEVLLCFHFP